jgi:PLP dependent protein
MSINTEKYTALQTELHQKAILVAVSKTKPVEDVQALYDLGQRDFGENYVQELVDKAAALPKDIRWHFIGHLQSNKVKYIIPFVHLIHGVDSTSLLQEINKQAAKQDRVIDCLLQVHIASEETKFGFDENELLQVDSKAFPHVRIVGLMGMASFSDNENQVRNEMGSLASLFQQYKNGMEDGSQFRVLSMGMSGDYKIALEEGSTMVRIGSLLFGERNKM